MMISRSPALPVKRQPKRIDTVQLPRPPRSPSLPLIRTSLTLTEMERKKRNKRQALFESGFFWFCDVVCVEGESGGGGGEGGLVGGARVVCMMIFHLKRKKNISQVQAFVGLFNAALSPVACVVRVCARGS